MPALALLLIIIAAIFHATWNFVAKKSGGTTVYAFSTALVTVILWTPVAVLLTSRSPELSIATWTSMGWLMVTLSALIHAIYYVVLLHGYKVAPLSVVYPIARGTGPLLSSFSAIILFGEPLTVFTGLGVLFIVLGIMLLSWSKEISIFDAPSLRGVAWGVLTGITISLYTLTDAYAVKSLEMNPVLYDYISNLIRVFILLPFALKSSISIFDTIKVNKKGILTIAILAPTAYILVLMAMQIAPVSHVAPAREISMLFGAFLGGKILKEGHLVQRMFAAGLIGVGVVFLVY